MLGMDLWDGSVNQLNLFKDISGITFPLLQKAGTKTTFLATLADLLIVDKEGVIRHQVSSLSAANRRSIVDQVHVLLSYVPNVEFSENFLNFGKGIPIGKSRTIPFQIFNNGTEVFEVTNFSSDLEGITVQPTNPIVLAGERQFVTVALTPIEVGRLSGTLSIFSKQQKPFRLSIVALTVEPSPSADFDNNGQVDFNDFLLFILGFNSDDPTFDLDQNGGVEFNDFLLFSHIFGLKNK